jgi:hypothetical protein
MTKDMKLNDVREGARTLSSTIFTGTMKKATLSIITLRIGFRYAECRDRGDFPVYRNAGYHYAECRGPVLDNLHLSLFKKFKSPTLLCLHFLHFFSLSFLILLN